MTRILAVLAGLACLLPAADAAVAPAKPPSPDAKAKAMSGPARNVKRPASPSAAADFVITPDSEVKLNGRPCRFQDVPNNAVITKIEVDAESKEILKVYFSTQK